MEGKGGVGVGLEEVRSGVETDLIVTGMNEKSFCQSGRSSG